MDALLERVNQALVRAKEVEKQGLMPQAQVLGYQRALLDAVNTLTLRRQDLELAMAELRALMSVAPGVKFTLARRGGADLLFEVTTASGMEARSLALRKLRDDGLDGLMGLEVLVK